MELKPHFDILVPGVYFCDIIFTGLPVFPALGMEIHGRDLTVVPGGVLNDVIGLQRLGVKVGWVSRLGNDFFSRIVLEWVKNEGVDTSLVTYQDSPLRQVTVSLSYPEDRAFVTYVDPIPSSVDMLFEVLDHVTFPLLHFSGLTIHERLPELIKRCHQRGAQVSMDCQHNDLTLDTPLVRAILSGLDLFMPNASEAQRLTQTDALSDAMAYLSELVPYVVIKNGAEGAIARHKGIDYREPALNVAPVDTTGAGDVFNAGFLAAHLAGMDTFTCLRWGNYCGGMSTQGAGGASTAPTRDQVEAWLARQG